MNIGFFWLKVFHLWGETATQPIAQLWQKEHYFEPRMGVDERQAKRERWRRALERSRSWSS